MSNYFQTSFPFHNRFRLIISKSLNVFSNLHSFMFLCTKHIIDQLEWNKLHNQYLLFHYSIWMSIELSIKVDVVNFFVKSFPDPVTTNLNIEQMSTHLGLPIRTTWVKFIPYLHDFYWVFIAVIIWMVLQFLYKLLKTNFIRFNEKFI